MDNDKNWEGLLNDGYVSGYDFCIKFLRDGVYVNDMELRVSTDSLVSLCALILSRQLFKGKFNVFQEGFLNDLKEAVGEVLKLYSTHTSQNHRNFS